MSEFGRDLSGTVFRDVLIDVEGLGVGVPRVVLTDSGGLYLGAEGVEPRRFGSGRDPTWSHDGRYLAWIADLPAEPFSPGSELDLALINRPRAMKLEILDTVTGEQVSYTHPAPGLSGSLLGITGGFIAGINGDNNLGRAAVRFVVITMEGLRDGQPESVVAPDFDLDLPNSSYDFEWVDSAMGTLYVVVTGTSTTWYRYSPVLWSVSMNGVATRLFSECDDYPVDGCLSNFGFRGVQVSPDQRHVVMSSGIRNGCETLKYPFLSTLDTLNRVAMSGLPEGPDEVPTSLVADGYTWTSHDTFLAVVGQRTSTHTSNGCRDEILQPTEIYECDIVGKCDSTGILANWVAADLHGNTAYAHPDPGFGPTRIVTIRWADGTEETALSERPVSWSP